MDNNQLEQLIIDLAQQDYSSGFHFIITMALGVYDWVITMSGEKQYIWGHATSSSSILFFIIRYSSLATVAISEINDFLGNSMNTCAITGPALMALDVLILSATAVYSAIRVYAIWGRKRWLFILVLLLGMINPLITSYLFIESSVTVYGGSQLPSGCGTYTKVSDTVFGIGLIAARTSSILADACVIVATWVRIWPMRAQLCRGGMRNSLTAVMFMDGTLYFLILLVANLVSLALIWVDELVYPLSQWISCLTVIFTCRFILDLHKTASVREVVAFRAQTMREVLTTSLPVVNPGTMPAGNQGLMSKLDVSFGSVSIFGTMIPWVENEGSKEDVEFEEMSVGSSRCDEI